MSATHPQCEVFPPQQYRFMIGAVLAVAAIGAAGWLAPLALLFVVPLFAVVLAIGAFSNAGLILSDDGIEWYALRRKWRFRKVPWSAVIGVRRRFLGLDPIVLTVEGGRYERWVWGTPRRDRPIDFGIWTNALVGGGDVLAALRRRLAEREPATAEADPGAGGRQW